MSSSIVEIAIRQVKSGQLDAFKQARTNFIGQLSQQTGVVVDREFESFYAIPAPDETEVFIGMTEWASAEAATAASSVLMGSEAANAFFATLDFKAYVMVVPIEGEGFDLGGLAAAPGQVLEVAVRRVKEGQEEAFNQHRLTFVPILDQQPGVLGSYEFQVVGGQQTERLTVGMTVYADQASFQQVAGSIMPMAETQAYFATFDPVALQYAVSVK